jgi:putative membrane protein
MKYAITSALLLMVTLALPVHGHHEPVSVSGAAPTAHATLVAVQGPRIEDWRFLREAAALRHAQVTAAKLAMSNGGDPAVREFGKLLLADQVAAGRRLTLLTLQTQVPLPQQATKADRLLLDRLEGLHATAFDRTFLAQFGVFAVRNAISLYRSEAESPGARPTVRRFALQFLPKLQEHLRIALKLQERLGPAPGVEGAPGVD